MLFVKEVKTFQHRKWNDDGREFKVCNRCIMKKHWFTIAYLVNNSYVFEDRLERDILNNSTFLY